jgi:PAS domain S-box-containing protein
VDSPSDRAGRERRRAAKASAGPRAGAPAEAAEHERLYDEAMHRQAPVGLSLIDRDLRYVRVNQVIADLNGVSIEEMLGRPYRDFSPETADVAEPFLRRVMEEGRSIRNLEVRARPPADPQVEHVFLLSLDPVRDADGEVIGCTSAVQDVSELRRSEQVAARRLQELETLYANAPVGLCYMDAELRVVHLNPRFARLSERPLAEQVGVRVPELLSGELAGQLVPRLRYVAQSGSSAVGVQIRGTLPGRGPREYTWVAHVHAVMSREDAVAGIIAVLQDVTVLADQQRRIEAVRDRLLEAQRVAGVGSWEWNLLDDEVWWSDELYTLFGEGPTYVPSYSGFFDHVHPSDRQTVREQIENTLADGKPYRVIFRILRGDGAERLLFCAAQLERTASGQPARLVGTCQDVTGPGPLDPA